ncbi:uncharacterized protein N7483_010714 [Penicillium malachiteum]|uniref:uncharacterized protein n=1 Tax=Penicillium malachiteum TaxID=1324776 RepID=UPI002548B8AC|nr:uncharacterized protein N7483_010714 [Penicillium malachiteum]KAJ5713533.1 hypothetical protein N7483_010714 [Penicillium malachiteum]
MSKSVSPDIDVVYYFEEKEIKIDFRHADRAAAYQALNREGRILSNQTNAVYLPISPGMSYIRDSRKGLIIGFTDNVKAEEWNKKSILGEAHSDKEVRIKRIWDSNELLDQQLQLSKFLSSEMGDHGLLSAVKPTNGDRPGSSQRSPSVHRSPDPEQQKREKEVTRSSPPSDGPLKKAMGSNKDLRSTRWNRKPKASPGRGGRADVRSSPRDRPGRNASAQASEIRN